MKQFYITSALLLSLLFSCTSPSQHSEGKESESSHEESNAVSLTEEQLQAVGIELGTLSRKALGATIQASGTLRVPNNYRAKATSLYGGVVKVINVKVGDKVSKGQVIATLANAQFIQLQEEYLTTQSRLILAEQELARQEELSQGGAGALKNLQSARSELSTLRTRRSALAEQFRLMGIRPESITPQSIRSSFSVTAPQSGIVVDILAQIGSYVDPSSPVAEIVDNSSLHLDLHIFERDLPKIQKGQTIHFRLTNNPDKEYDAKVYNIGTSLESDNKTISVHSEVLGDRSGLIDGMHITGIVSLVDEELPALPSDAVVSHEGKDYVFLLQRKDDKKYYFQRIEVVRGSSKAGFVALTFVTELPGEAQFITRGAFFALAKMTNQGDSHGD